MSAPQHLFIDIIPHRHFPNEYELRLGYPLAEGAFGILTKVEFERVERHQALPQEANMPHTLGRATLQQLANQLYRLGIKPDEAQDTPTIATAQHAHIEDLRSIVDRLFNRLPTPCPTGSPLPPQ